MRIFKQIAKIISKLNPFTKKDQHSSPLVEENSNEELFTLPNVEILIDETEFKKDEISTKKVISEPENEVLDINSIEFDTTTNLDEDEDEDEEEDEDEDEDEIKLKKLHKELEKLNKEFFQQKKLKIVNKPVDFKLVEIILKEIKTEDFFISKVQKRSSNNKLKLEKRTKDLIKINKLKSEAINFSLINIYNERKSLEEEKEKIKQEVELENQFNKLISSYKISLSSFEFDKANQLLIDAMDLGPGNKNKIDLLKNDLVEVEKKYQQDLIEFKRLIKVAEINFHNNEFEKAIEFYGYAKQLNIDNQICERRISDSEYKIERLKTREEELTIKEFDTQQKNETLKKDAKEIIDYLKQNGINNLYHYTDSRNIDSILQKNGLLSIRELERESLVYNSGSNTREKPEYIRLSYTKNHPLLYVSKEESRILIEKTLEIDISATGLEQTIFTNVNAARTSSYPTVQFGDNLDFIKKHVKLDIVKLPRCPSKYDSDHAHAYYQAEVMIKKHLPLSYINNL